MELLDGEILVMSPIGIRHILAVTWINEWFGDRRRGRYAVSPGNPVFLHDYSEPQPDIMLVPRARRMEHKTRPEEVFLLVEVSDSSLAFDRGRKRKAYAEAGVRDYWIVNLEEDVLEVYRRPEGGRGKSGAGGASERLSNRRNDPPRHPCRAAASRLAFAMSDSLSDCSSRDRLGALYRYEILDTPPERDFDDVCALAAQICEAPIASLTFLDRSRQWFKSEIGLGVCETPLDHSICRHAILEQDYLVVNDTLADPRFQANPFCTGEAGLRFYAGAVIRTPDGFPIGSVCVLDRRPRGATPQQVEGLQTLARQVMTMLELRRSNRALVQTQADLTAALTAATEANAAKDEFLAKLSHELRTPLMPVVMSVGALLETPDLPDEVREDLAMVLRNVKLETRLIDDLLDVTRIAHGKLELTLQECDLHAVARDALRVCLPAFEEKSIALAVELQAARHAICGDPARLQQVFWNLLTNAAKFTPEGGTVTIRSANADSDGELECVLEVADTGRGIETELIDGLFDAFEQGGRGVTRKYGGLGLGLAICKGVVDLHGGRISARSRGVGFGTTFTVALATVTPHKPENAPPTEHAASVAAAMRILLVEDHEPTATVLARLLRRSGHTIEHAPTVAEARRLAGSATFDLVMSDLGLPDGTGLELMEELRGTYGLSGIALSGYGMDADLLRSRNAGFVAHLTKPVDIAHLRRTLLAISDARASAVR
ncbi:MAG TPA: ATP-binding protein [Chthoniobacteraceae bacterium]|nr:ATP-binding protein [Chthoniobacteraceae bacterium]